MKGAVEIETYIAIHSGARVDVAVTVGGIGFRVVGHIA